MPLSTPQSQPTYPSISDTNPARAPNTSVFDFRDASLHGDRRWSSASRFTSHAPAVVFTLAILSIIQIVLGVVWITSIQSAQNNLTFAQVIQPLIIPGLSFFNTIPSLHLHVLARSNNPVMAMAFSAIMGLLYLASAVVFLPPCVGKDAIANQDVPVGGRYTGGSGGYGGTECPPGSRRGIWVAIVVLQFLSAAGYATHFGMAWKVRKVVKRREQGERDGTIMVVVDQAEKERREEEARQRWREIRDL